MTRKPNIVLFISDEQRADTMPGVSPIDVYAPHAAWLARQGAVFRNAFCTAPICSPARGSILTGLYPHTTGMVCNYDMDPKTFAPICPPMPNDARVIADYLKPDGYTCAYVGKWHLPTGDDRRGFTDFVRRVGHHDIESEASDDALRFTAKTGIGEGIGLEFASYLNRPGTEAARRDGATKLPLAFHNSAFMAEEAVAFIRAQAGSDKPFLLVYSCVEPHPMGLIYNTAPCPFDRMYNPKDMPLPETRRDPAGPELMRRRAVPSLKSAEKFSDDQLRELMAGYYATVSYVDHLLGVALGALLATDQLDDTLVIFTSDHGEMMADHCLLKKGPVMYESLINVPLIVKPPAGAPKGLEVASLVSHVDLLPTILNYCGAQVPGHLPGKDLHGLLNGQEAELREGVAVEYHSRRWGHSMCPVRAWRTREWKYVETLAGPEEFYNLKADPLEARNLIADPAYDGIKTRLRGALYKWLAESGDAWPSVIEPERLEGTVMTASDEPSPLLVRAEPMGEMAMSR